MDRSVGIYIRSPGPCSLHHLRKLERMKAFTLYERFHWTYENLLKAGKNLEWFAKHFGNTEVYFIKIKAPAVTEAIH